MLGVTSTPSGQRFDTGAIITVLNLVTEYIYVYVFVNVVVSFAVIANCDCLLSYEDSHQCYSSSQ